MSQPSKMSISRSKSRQNPLSLLAIFLIAIVVSGVFNEMKRWQEPMAVIQWDIKNYYAYLPAVFIYGDHSLEFTKENPEFFADKFWPTPTPTGCFAIITTMGLAMLYLPFFLLGHLAAMITGAEMDGFSPPYAMMLVFSSLFYVVLGLVALRKVLLRFFGDGITALTLLAMFFATNLFFYTALEGPMSHAYSFALFAGFILFTIKWYEKPGLKASLMLGLISGLIVLIRPTNIVILVFFVLFGIKSFADLKQRFGFFAQNYRLILLIAAAALLVWLPQLLYWKSVSGQWFYYSYKEGEGFFFNNPQIIRGLFSYRKGWLVYTPIMVLALSGIALLWWRRRELFWPMLTFTLINIYVVLSWWSWWYGGGFGLRAFIESYALLAIPFATLLQAAGRRAKVLRNTLIGLTVLLIIHGIFQTAQYHYGAIHWEAMNKTTYWASFGRKRPLPGFYEALSPPDIGMASKGIQAVVKKEQPQFHILQSIVFDMETFNGQQNMIVSACGKFIFNPGSSLTSARALSGRHSLKAGRKTEKNIITNIPLQPGEQWVVSVKRQSRFAVGSLVLTGENGAHFYEEIRVGLPTASPGWDSLSLKITIPEAEISAMQVIIRNTGFLNAWFDDLVIEKVEQGSGL